jgi:[ribosomal protein S5]-alanine N-acetyltransferase
MATAPLLDTPRLRLEPFGLVHLTARYVSWLNDPDVVRFSEQRHHRHSLESCRAYVASVAESTGYLWAIVAKDTTLGHIGNISAVLDPANALADVAILLGERMVWGRGFGGEAWTAVCRFLLDSGVRKVAAGTLALNHGMLRIMTRAGMHEDGRRVRHYLVNGVATDLVHMALFSDNARDAGAAGSATS